MFKQRITGTFAERKDAGKIMVAHMHEIIMSGNIQPKQFIVLSGRIRKEKNVTNSSLVNNIWINIIKEPMERGGILNVASISVGPLNVPCTKKLVQNLRKLRNNRLSRNRKRSSNFFRILFTCFLHFPRGH